MSVQHRFWWRVLRRYEGDEMWVPILKLSFVHSNDAISLKKGLPRQRKPYRVIQRGLRRYLGLSVSPTRAQQLANEALAHAVFAFYRKVIPSNVDRSVVIRKLTEMITEGRREKDKTRRVKENGVHRVADEVHLWLPPKYAGDSAGHPDPEPEPGRGHGFIMEWLARQ